MLRRIIDRRLGGAPTGSHGHLLCCVTHLATVIFIFLNAPVSSNEPRPTLPGPRLRSTARNAGTGCPSTATSIDPAAESCASLTGYQRPLAANAAEPRSALMRTRSPPYT